MACESILTLWNHVKSPQEPKISHLSHNYSPRKSNETMKTHRSLYVPWEPQRMAALKPNGTQMETHVSWREPRWQAKTLQCKRPSWSWIEKGCKRPRAFGAGDQSCRFPKIQAAAAARSLQERTQRWTKGVLAFIFPQLPTKTSQRVHKSILNHIWEN